MSLLLGPFLKAYGFLEFQLGVSTHHVDMKMLLSHRMKVYGKSNVSSLAGSEMAWEQEKEATVVFMVTWRCGRSEDSHAGLGRVWLGPPTAPHVEVLEHS